MTKLGNKGSKKSAAWRKTRTPAALRTAGRKMVSRSQVAFKQQRSQLGGNWLGNSNRNQGTRGLSYEFSQRKQDTKGKIKFSSFFAPSSRYAQAEIIEIGLLIRKRWVGGLIGRKGKTLWMIRDKSNGANIDFGKDEIVVDRSMNKKWEQSPWPGTQKEKYVVCAISGSKAQAVGAAQGVAEQISKATQSSFCKLEFLVPASYIGVFIGKKGANLKQMRGPMSEGVSINIRDEPILLGTSRTKLCTLFGPAEGMMKTIERAANWLGDISLRVQMDRIAEQPL